MTSQTENATVHTTQDEKMNSTNSQNSRPASAKVPRYNSKPRNPEAGTSFEVFRNNTTAVEVIVKEVPFRHRRTKTTLSSDYDHVNYSNKIYKLEEEIESLKIELNRANAKFALSRKGSTNLVAELQNQIETIGRREADEQYHNIQLRMENEKLNTQLASKSRLVTKLRKEIIGMQRLLKYVVKGLRLSPNIEANYSLNSEPEYDDFEKGLKNENHVHFNPTVLDVISNNVTLESNVSKNMNSF